MVGWFVGWMRGVGVGERVVGESGDGGKGREVGGLKNGG